MTNRAYSVLNIKSIEETNGKRIFRGIATTPAPDRMGDIVEPTGAEFTLPIPLLWQHDSRQPVGWVTKATVTDSGIEVECEIATVEEDGPLKTRLAEAWASLKAKLVRGLSIGFGAIESARIKDTYCYHFLKWAWYELSLVTIPANQEASITSIKSIDAAMLKAHGIVDESLPVVSGSQPAAKSRGKGFSLKPPKQEVNKMTLTEQRKALEASIVLKTTRMKEILQKGADAGTSTDAEEGAEIDQLQGEIELAQADIERLKKLEVIETSVMTTVTKETTGTVQKGSEARGGNGGQVFNGAGRIQVTRNLPKGTAFTRYVIAMAAGRGSYSDSLAFAQAKGWAETTPEIVEYMKANAGTSTHATWAGPLVEPANLVGEFIELLMPGTILGKITGLRKVPFNVRIPIQTGGSTVNWVGEAAAKPVGDMAFDAMELGVSKIAGIIVLTDELIRLATPSAVALVQTDMTKQVTKFMDAQFLDPTVTATAARPASVTQGVTPIVSTGTDADAFRADMRALRAPFHAANLPTAGAVIVMNTNNADSLADMQNPLGQPEFPGLTAEGGNYRGRQVVVSENVPSDSDGGMIVMLLPSEILYADDGVTVIDSSKDATLDMAGGDTPTFNLFQKNCTAIRAERWLHYKKARAAAVQYISGANYGLGS